mmetsp:Transcript_98994/g.221068  ORF Transcript_98994/g.221068 Transcript_98994/m.221068 type:complete len:267 (+) Transcript_98994:327-1127(+)
MMSPMPESPARVSGCAPMAVANQRISALPCVTRADMALRPSPRPSQIPAAIARTFFRAPATSQPTTSSVMLTRKYFEVISLCTAIAASLSTEAATIEVGRRSRISLAKDGPETATTGFSSDPRPMASGMTSAINNPLPSSIPLEHATIGTPRGTRCRTFSSTCREACTGTAWITAEQPARTSAGSSVARRLWGRSNSLRYFGFTCRRLMKSRTSRLRVNMRTVCPLRAMWAAMAVPKAPPPSTPISSVVFQLSSLSLLMAPYFSLS